MSYQVSLFLGKREIRWELTDSSKDTYPPTLADFLEAAKKEFPTIPLNQLEVVTEGYNAEVTLLHEKY